MENQKSMLSFRHKSEARIQAEIFTWFWNNYCLPVCNPRSMMFHVPNENQHKLKTKGIGIVNGVSDLVLIHDGQTYFIEVKADDGKQSESQIEFQYHAKCVGVPYLIVRTLQQFQKLIQETIPANVIRLI